MTIVQHHHHHHHQQTQQIQKREPIDPIAIAQMHDANARAYRSGLNPAANVACGKCRACCYHPDVEVDPLHDRTDVLDTERLPNGTRVLRRNEDGSCIHLTPAGCNVYEHRPRTCRAYDCRYWALLGVSLDFAPDQKTPEWTFKSDTVAKRTLVQALRLLAFLVEVKAREHTGGMPDDKDISQFAQQHGREMWAKVRDIGGATMDEVYDMAPAIKGDRPYTRKEKKLNDLLCHFEDKAELLFVNRGRS